MSKSKYNDTACGIRTITQIKNLPVYELTDEEICKLFFFRFKAKAMIMVYIDEHDEYHLFGRLFNRTKWVSAYRRLLSLILKARDGEE